MNLDNLPEDLPTIDGRQWLLYNKRTGRAENRIKNRDSKVSNKYDRKCAIVDGATLLPKRGEDAENCPRRL